MIELTLVQVAKRLLNSFRMLLRKLSHLSKVRTRVSAPVSYESWSIFSLFPKQFLCTE